MLRTKLHVPARHELVPRTELLGRLAADGSGTGSRRLTLVVAPPGWGKTSLLSQWADADPRPFAWVSLDPADNDRVRFWTYVVEALRGIDPSIGAAALALLPARGAGETEAFLPSLLNDLESSPEPVVLALDDYHVIGNGEIHRAMSYLVDHLPTTAEVAIATRIAPPLPLARLAARRELLEIREGALRFSDAEAASLLNDLLGLDLSADEVTMLQRRSEGWAAGLCLAALSLQGRTDAGRFIESFAGTDRHIVDYLSAEVLDGASPEDREFLLGTSFLARMCAPLCDSVLDRAGSQAMLEELERANLFVVPLDTTREWFRYHHLFAELLRHELRATTPELERRLHERAAAWFLAHDLVPEAIHHAVRAGDVASAGATVADHWLTYFNLGRLATVERWLDELPGSIVADDPRLCVARAWLAMDRGALDDVQRWTDEAARAIDRSAVPDAEALRPSVEILRTVRRFKEGDLTGARSAAVVAMELLGEEPSFPLTVAFLMHGVTDLWLGHDDRAATSLEHAAALGHETGNALGTAYALGYLALLRTDGGDSDRAEAALDEVDRIVDRERIVGEHFVAMVARLARGRLRERQGKVEEADDALERSLTLARRGAGRLEIAASLLSLAERRHAERDVDGAKAFVAEARQLVEACEDPGEIHRWLTRTEKLLRGSGNAERGGQALTERESVVLRMLPTELSQREIADALFVSRNTVKTQLKGIYQKLGASNREEAVVRARELGLL